jgi:hypothetical protein
MNSCSPTIPVDNDSTDHDQICEVDEQFLCSPPDPSAHTITGEHLITSAHITHMGTVVNNDQTIHGTANLVSEVTFCWWGMNAGQYTDLPSVQHTDPQVPLYPGHYTTLSTFTSRSSGPNMVTCSFRFGRPYHNLFSSYTGYYSVGEEK